MHERVGESHWTLLHSACYRESLEMMDLLIEAGVDVNLTNDQGETAVHSAVRMDSLKALERLVKAGANIQVQSNDNKTPLSLCRAGGINFEAIEALLRRTEYVCNEKRELEHCTEELSKKENRQSLVRRI